MVPIGMCVYFKDILRQGKMVSAQTKDSRVLYDGLFSTIHIISSVAAGIPVGLVTFQVLWQCSCYVIHSWSFGNMVLLKGKRLLASHPDYLLNDYLSCTLFNVC
jgi:hypothetical protein